MRDVRLFETADLLLAQPELAGGQRVGYVAGPGGPDDGRGHARPGEQPGQRDLGRRRAARRRDLGEPVGHVEVGGGAVPLIRERVVAGPGGAAPALPAPVAGPQAAGQRAVWQERDAPGVRGGAASRPRASGLYGSTATPWSAHSGIISRSSSRYSRL